MNKLYIAGIGPGGTEYMTRRAYRALEEADLIVGYTLYNDLIREEFPEKVYYSTPMTKERERCLYALKSAAEGKKTVMVCSGDSGVYGMASLVFELAEETGIHVDIEALSGITAALSAGALAGAAVSGDFAAVSLSDLLTPWDVIEKRIQGAAAGDFVIALYNPGSKKRRDHLKKVCRIVGKFRSPDTICAMAEQIGRPGERVRFLSLKELEAEEANMFQTILIGNSSTRIIQFPGGVQKMVTPRGYSVTGFSAENSAENSKERFYPEETEEQNRDRNCGKSEKNHRESETHDVFTECENRLVIFGGTTEGRRLAEFACACGVPVTVCVATSYGEQMLASHPLLEVNSQGLEKEEIEDLLSDPRITAVLDATHPYAAEITEKVASACEKTGRKYIRVLRDISDLSSPWRGESLSCENVIFAANVEEAAGILDRVEGRALITTGSKEAAKYMSVRDSAERLIFRVLPSKEALQACEAAGISGKNLICMQGPFSVEMNHCMMKERGADYLVTKISGRNGGFEEKLEAARQAGVKVIAVLPPESRKGISVEEAFALIEKTAGNVKRKGAAKKHE